MTTDTVIAAVRANDQAALEASGWNAVFDLLRDWPGALTERQAIAFLQLCGHEAPAAVVDAIREWAESVDARAAGYRPMASQIANLIAANARASARSGGMRWDVRSIEAIIALGSAEYTAGFFRSVAAGHSLSTPSARSRYARQVREATEAAA